MCWRGLISYLSFIVRFKSHYSYAILFLLWTPLTNHVIYYSFCLLDLLFFLITLLSMDLCFFPQVGHKILEEYTLNFAPLCLLHTYPNPHSGLLQWYKNDYKMCPCSLMLCLHLKSNCPSTWVFHSPWFQCHHMKYSHFGKVWNV